MSTIVELRGELDAKRETLAKVFEEAGETFDMDNVKSLEGDSAGKAEKIKSMNDEITDLAKRLEDVQNLQGMKDSLGAGREVQRHEFQDNGGNGGGNDGRKGREIEKPKSLGEAFADSDAR